MTNAEAAATLGITEAELEAMLAGIKADEASIRSEGAGGTWTNRTLVARRNPQTGQAEWV